jgi:aminoglycoside N3'-acetyltransferase
LLEKDKHTHVFSTSANISRELRFWWKTYTDIGNIPEIFRNSLNHKKTPS